MKKGITLYLTFAVLCVIAICVCVAGCKPDSKPAGGDGTSSVLVSENPNEGLINSRYDNDDYDRTDVSNVVSNFGEEPTTSSESTSSGSTSSEDVTSQDPSGDTSSSESTSSGIRYESDNEGWTSRWY